MLKSRKTNNRKPLMAILLAILMLSSVIFVVSCSDSNGDMPVISDETETQPIETADKPTPEATKAETKVIAKIVDILEDMALEIEEMEEQVDTLNDYAEELDEDLGDVEDYLFGDDDDCDCCDDDDCDCCDCCDDEEFFEVECPKCGEVICLDEDFDADEVICPACNETIPLEDEE